VQFARQALALFQDSGVRGGCTARLFAVHERISPVMGFNRMNGGIAAIMPSEVNSLFFNIISWLYGFFGGGRGGPIGTGRRSGGGRDRMTVFVGFFGVRDRSEWTDFRGGCSSPV
jgi:hypothetical protein